MLELAGWWGVFLVAAGVYWRALRATERRSPARRRLDPLLTATFRAGVAVGSWSTGSGEDSAQLRIDPHYLVLELGRRHRAVVPRAQVGCLVDGGLLGWRVEHAGEETLTFSVRREDGFAAAAVRLGWPVRAS